MPMLAILGHNPNVKFDVHRFTWLGSSSNFSDDAYVMIVRDDAPVKSIEQMRKPGGPELVLGGTADGATGGDVPRILQAALGLQNMKLILGYRDSAAVFLAMERNEVPGRTTDLSAIYSTRPTWLKPGGGYRVLVQYGRRDRHPEYPRHADRARACDHGGRPRPDRVHGDGIAHHVAALRRATGHTCGPRQGAEGRV